MRGRCAAGMAPTTASTWAAVSVVAAPTSNSSIKVLGEVATPVSGSTMAALTRTGTWPVLITRKKLT